MTTTQVKVVLAGLAIFIAYLPIAVLVGSWHSPAISPSGAVVEPLLSIVPTSQLSYRAQSFVLGKYADASEDNMRSPVMLYEDLTPLGPARSYVKDIYDSGQGRFNFVRFSNDPRSFVLFSASDNSDPRTNGRKYWLVLP
jgi:hypothetical protein